MAKNVLGTFFGTFTAHETLTPTEEMGTRKHIEKSSAKLLCLSKVKKLKVFQEQLQDQTTNLKKS